MALSKVVLSLPGLSPTHDETTLRSTLSDISTLSSVTLDKDAKQVTATILGDVEPLLTKLSDATPSVISQKPHVALSVKGMTCNSCVKAIKDACLEARCENVDVSLETGILKCFYSGLVKQLATELSEKTKKCVTPIPPTMLRVHGMTCQKCVNRVKSALENAGAWDIHVSLETETSKQYFTGDVQSLPHSIFQSTAKRATVITPIVLNVVRMSSPDCADAVKRASREAGAFDVHIDLTTGRANMLFDGDLDKLVRLIKKGSGKDATVESMRDWTLRIDGMTCMRCVNSVKKGLQDVAGTENVTVDLDTELATLSYSGDASTLIQAVAHAGKKASVVDTRVDSPEKTCPISANNQTSAPVSRAITLRVDGMTCMRCVNAVTRALQDVDGTENVLVDLDTELATLSYSGDESVLIAAVSKEAKKKATLADPRFEAQNDESGTNHLEGTATPLTKPVTLHVDGMTCMRCVNAVTKALQEVDGTENVAVDLTSGLATLSYAGEESILIEAISKGARKDAKLVDSESHHERPLLKDTDEPREQDVSRTVKLRVIGMTCMSCVSAVTKALESVSGAKRVMVDLATGLATLSYDGAESTLIQAIFEGAGKEAILDTELERESRGVTLRVEGMTCMKCVAKITRVLSELETAEDVQVSLDTGLATLTFAGDDDELVQAVAKAGKTATVVAADYEAFTELSIASPTQRDYELLSFGAPTDHSSLTTTQLRVEGMTCASCVGVVEDVLKKLPGVSSAKVNLLAGRATVMHDDKESTAVSLSDAVSSSGYQSIVLDSSNPEDRKKANGQDRTFRIDFPTDLQADNALKVLRYLDGVKSVTASYSTVTITLNPGAPKSTILRALELDGSFGKMFLRQSAQEEREALQRGENEGPTEVIDKETRMWWKKLVLAVVLFLPIGITSLTSYFYFIPSMGTNAWLHFLLATPIQFICGAGFYRASYYALKKRRATMDCLIALSTSIAYFSSVVVILLGLGSMGEMGIGHSAMFRTSAMILMMVIAGKYIESRSKKQAARGVAEISQLSPNDAVLYDEKEEVSCFTVIPAKLVDVGDVVKVIAGDKIAVDGDVIDGVSAVDESMMTGESSAVPKSKGDHVIGGTVNGSGSMLVRATAVGADSVLAQIVKLVNDAQTSRAPVEAFADAVSAVFVPAVIGISVLVFLVWFGVATMEWIPEEWYAADGKFFFALLFALETMVIACPCALGLATPTAVMVASSVGTKMGVLFRSGGAAIEAAKNVRTVLFDKTGTLTKGKPAVAGTIMGERGMGITEQANVLLDDLIYLVESESHHPLAAAITKHIETKTKKEMKHVEKHNSAAYKISSMEEVPGRGITACINKGEYTLRIGSTGFVFSKVSRTDVLTDSEMRAMDRMEQEDGLTLVSAVVNNELACVFGLEDTIRDEAPEVVKTLHSMGIETGLITGDSNETGRAIGSKAGIPRYGIHAEALPWTKVSVVEENEPACFVGDGMNDAPALAAASLGIAIGAGAPVAAESAGVVLVGGNLEGVVNAIDLARSTFRRVRINFVWAIGYNVLGIPLAAGVLYPWFGIRIPPVIASGAMALSSSCVILSSLGLYMYKPKMRKKEGEMETRDNGLSRLTRTSMNREDVVDVPLLSAEV